MARFARACELLDEWETGFMNRFRYPYEGLSDSEANEKERNAQNVIKEIVEQYGDRIAILYGLGDGYGKAFFNDLTEEMESKSWLNPAWNPKNRVKPKYKKKTISSELKLRILKKCGYECVSCKGKHDLCIDHIHPEFLGGDLDPENLQVLCRSCNSKKGISI